LGEKVIINYMGAESIQSGQLDLNERIRNFIIPKNIIQEAREYSRSIAEADNLGEWDEINKKWLEKVKLDPLYEIALKMIEIENASTYDKNSKTKELRGMIIKYLENSTA